MADDDLFNNVLIGNSWEGYVIEQIAQFLPDTLKIRKDCFC